MTDKTLTCVECGRDFTWTSGEQQFFAERKLHEPKRCKDCRQKKKHSAA